jgi:putative FmdB family regulatory protein
VRPGSRSPQNTESKDQHISPEKKMPIFEYQCASCGKEFEILVRHSSPAPGCPVCSGTELRKKLSAFATISGASSAQAEFPASCQSCGNPGGPGACAFSANQQ